MEHQVIGVPGPQGARRVALLIDGDNLAPSFSSSLYEAAQGLGRVDVRRVYAAEAGIRAWQATKGFRLIQVAGSKNASDLLLCIEAVELACEGGFDTFAIASDDRDFGHLAHWLRERGSMVLGLGTGKSPASWQAACTEFRLLRERAAALVEPEAGGPRSDSVRAAIDQGPDGASSGSAPRPTPQGAPKPKPRLTAIDQHLRDLIAQRPEGVRIQFVGSEMGKAKLLPRTGGWRGYLATRPDLYALEPKGPDARVRWVGA